LTIITKLVVDYSILVEDPNLGASIAMENGLDVCEEKDEEGRINNSFGTKAFNFNGDFNFNQLGRNLSWPTNVSQGLILN
jgi:hypothetical protein